MASGPGTHGPQVADAAVLNTKITLLNEEALI